NGLYINKYVEVMAKIARFLTKRCRVTVNIAIVPRKLCSRPRPPPRPGCPTQLGVLGGEVKCYLHGGVRKFTPPVDSKSVLIYVSLTPFASACYNDTAK